MPYSGGLKRNIVQCLEDYNIPLKLSHTVVDIKGKERLEGVTLAAVDASILISLCAVPALKMPAGRYPGMASAPLALSRHPIARTIALA